jgi:hypothetical protein
VKKTSLEPFTAEKPLDAAPFALKKKTCKGGRQIVGIRPENK